MSEKRVIYAATGKGKIFVQSLTRSSCRERKSRTIRTRVDVENDGLSPFAKLLTPPSNVDSAMQLKGR